MEYATEDAMVEAMLAGEVDAIDWIPGTAIKTLQEAGNIEVPIIDGYGLDNLAINSHEDGTQPESLGDPVVRLALEYALDRQKIIDVVYLGYASPGITPIAPALGDWHNSEIEAIPFDIDEGNRILDEAGYLDTDGDGIREWSDGSPLEYRLMAEDSASYARMLEIISDGWAQVGISAPPILMDYDSMFAVTTGVWDFDMVVWSWGMDIDPDFGLVVFLCDQRDAWGWSDSGYCNDYIEELYILQGSETDHDKRLEYIWEFQEFIYNERPWLVLTYNPVIQAYRSDKFTGFYLPAGSLLEPYSLMQVQPVP
jgi:peptide/nickel transport system substrate-binding protein